MSRGHATRSWLVVILAPFNLRGLCASNLLTVLPHHPEWDIPADSVSLDQLAKSHGSCSVEFEEEGDKVRVFLRTWDRDIDIFRRVCVAMLDRYSSDPHQEISALSRIVDALGPDVSVASISGGSTILVEVSCEYLGSGYRQKIIDYTSFDLRLFKRCLQRTASSVFVSLDRLAMTEFIINLLKGAGTRDWMSSRPALKKAILTNDLHLPHLGDVVANIIGVWSLIVSYLKNTGRKFVDAFFVVRSSSFGCVGALSYAHLLYLVLFQKKGIDGWQGTSTWIRWLE